MSADLAIHVEWLDAPGVTDVVDAALWARLEITATTASGVTLPLTELRPAVGGSTRRAVYGSVFPLACWVVQNYWSILWETSRVPRAKPGRDLAQIVGLRPWVQRHCLLAAQEGFALPDLTLSADGDDVVLSSFPDPPDRGPAFLASVSALPIPRHRVVRALRTWMGNVMERLHGLRHPDADALRHDWAAIEGADPDEAYLCSSAARLGLDPYDAAVMTDEVERALRACLTTLPHGLLNDLLDAARGMDELWEVNQWVSDLGLSRGGLEPATSGMGAPVAATAHESGYLRARAIRKQLGVEPSYPGHRRLFDRLDFEFKPRDDLPLGFVGPIEALVTSTESDRPRLVPYFGPESARPIPQGRNGRYLSYAAQAFRSARALYLWQFGYLRAGPRALTRSNDRIQRESRAFAAEFLVPADGLREMVDRAILGEDEVEVLARHWHVSTQVIRHQIENHGLASLA